MTVYEDIGPARARRGRKLAVLGWIAAVLFGGFLFWTMVSHVGPLPEPQDIPDWHGNVAAGD